MSALQAEGAFICDGVRTPFGRYGGALAAVRPDDMAAHVLAALLQRSPQLDPERIDEVFLGCANQAGEDNRNIARMSLLLAGLPTSVPGATFNRLCASGLHAVAAAARAVAAGEASVVLAGGVESMSRAPFVIGKSPGAFARDVRLEDSTIGWRFVNPRMRELFGTDTMPETAENIAEQRGVSRTDQDAFALRSQQRAETARRDGTLAGEIVPIGVPKRRDEVDIVAVDEHPRPATTLAKLAELPAPFRAGGTVTAGNSSGINDGAAALLVASGRAAARFGLNPLARVVCSAAAGVEPGLMGLGPVPAAGRALRFASLDIADIGLVEINEAFAAQVLACLREWELADDHPRVNPNGGAIALGHPLGASGARLVASAARELQRGGEKLALCTMCVGVGQGEALVLERC